MTSASAAKNIAKLINHRSVFSRKNVIVIASVQIVEAIILDEAKKQKLREKREQA